VKPGAWRLRPVIAAPGRAGRRPPGPVMYLQHGKRLDSKDRGVKEASEPMKVAVFGLGYVGTVTAAALASNGHQVWGVDVDPTKVKLVAGGQTPVLEPGLQGLIRSAVLAGRLHASTDRVAALDDATVSLICVGTPSSPRGSTDLSHVERVVADIANTFAAGASAPDGRHALVVRSTVPPGTVDELISPLLESRLAGSPVQVLAGMCPEFLRESSAISDFYDAPFTVIGTRHPYVADKMRELLSFLSMPLRVVEPREAESLKYACNAFHAVKVTFANEVGRLLRTFGVDAREVMRLFCEDTKLNISPNYLAPGFAFGGSCLPKDLRSLLYLARMSSIDLPLLAAVLATNELSIGDVVSRVVASDVHHVAILGLSFKVDSDDLRESPYVDLAETLLGKGFDVRIFDPIVDPQKLVGANRRHLVSKLPHVQRTLRQDARAALEGAELALVGSNDPSIVDALVEAPPPKIIDLNGRLGRTVESLESYEGVAW
jgi:GDP-mannose 6-dehydrogenase